MRFSVLILVILSAIHHASALPLTFTIEVWRVPLKERLKHDADTASELKASLLATHVPLHRGRLQTSDFQRFSYRNGTKLNIIDDFTRNQAGEITPLVSEVFIGMDAQFDVFPYDEQKKVIIDYDLRYTDKPRSSRTAGVSVTDSDTTMKFDYRIEPIPEIRAMGRFIGPLKGERLLFETTEGENSFLVIIAYDRDTETAEQAAPGNAPASRP